MGARAPKISAFTQHGRQPSSLNTIAVHHNTHHQLLFHFVLLPKPSKPRGVLDGYNNHGSGWGRSKFTSKVHTPTFFFSTDDEPNASSPPESFEFTSIHTKSTERGKRAVFHDGRHPRDRYGDAEPYQQYEQREPEPE